MAGDWVKVEKSTPRKPEVLAIAQLLSIHPDQAFGLCFRFWSWCDDHLLDGHAKNVTNVTLDLVIGHAGFASALLEVGWLQARNGSFAVPKFDRHLSQGAKNRALAVERKRLERSRSKRDNSVTREEKRREDIIDERKTRAKLPKSADEVVTHGKTLYPPADAEFCRWWYDKLEGAGWVDENGNAIGKWTHAMAAAWRGRIHAEQRRSSNGHPPKRTAEQAI